MPRVHPVPGASVSDTPKAHTSSRLLSQQQRFSRRQRLLSPGDYKAVFDNAAYRISHKYFLLLARPNNDSCSRLGLIVAKKNVRQSVDRNRVKRVARETFRLWRQVDMALDIVFLARRGIDELPPDMQTRVLREGWQRLTNKAAVKAGSS